MFLKGKQAERFCKSPKPDIWAVLVFGEDEGLAADAAGTLIRSWTPKSRKLQVISLDDESLRKDPSTLFDGLDAVSLLGDESVIRVRTNGDKSAKLLLEAITLGEQTPGRFSTRLIIQTGSLKKRSKLRSTIEVAKHAACLQFFADEATDIRAALEAALDRVGATIKPEALDLFVGDLPGHRSIATAEMEKLTTYAHQLGRPLNVTDVRALSATDVEHALSDAVRAVLSGQVAEAHKALDKLEVAGTSPITILRSLQSETLRLLDAHIKIAGGNANPGMKLRPPVWQSDWPRFKKQLSLWPPSRLRRILERIYEAEYVAKKQSASSASVVRLLINDLVRAAEKMR